MSWIGEALHYNYLFTPYFMYTITVTCPRGLEEQLQKEVQTICNQPAKRYQGLITLQGDLKTVYRLNLYSRLASRVLILLISGQVSSQRDTYNLACQVDWPIWFRVENRFKVHVEGFTPWSQRLNFLALKVKDAVCDIFRKQTGKRPSVDKINNNIRLFAYLNHYQAHIYIDSSGEALFKRGWREKHLLAPLRENLAASLLTFAGYVGNEAFIDPMCGSGTIAIEAAMLASQTPPGLHRQFAFEYFLNFDSDHWQSLKKEAQNSITPPSKPIYAYDQHPHAIKTAQANAKKAGVLDFISFAQLSFTDLYPKENKGQLICNPPYGERMNQLAQIRHQYPHWSEVLKKHFSGWQVGFITSDFNFPKILRLTPKRKIPLYNGKLECRFYLFDIVKGSNRRTAKQV